ncbi:MAG TPA: hypothetical protein VFX47_01565 [Gammaproteobacteria bacterium]|nr:hypothetical protein [Gammaproteobacteria bacterium]
MWLFRQKTKQFYMTFIGLGLILGISMRWLHQDFLSGLGIGIAIAAAFMAAPYVRKNRE